MLTIYTTEFAHDHRVDMYRKITQHIDDARRVILIVPEQQTLSAEAEAAARLPACAPLFFEVTNFSRLANTAFRSVGGLSQTYSDSTAKALLMWRALREAAPLLSNRKSNDISAGEVKEALAAIGEMQALGLTSDDLSEAAKHEELAAATRLRGKLYDLSLISAIYHRLHDERFADVGEELHALASLLKRETELFSATAFFLDGFTSFTEPQLWVLQTLMSRADMTVYVTLPKEATDAFEYTETKRTEGRLLRLADVAGVSKSRNFLVGNNRMQNEGLYQISRNLWRQNVTIDNEYLQKTQNCLTVCESDTPFDSAELVASLIQKRVIEEGASYRDFAVIMRHAETYRGVLDTALREAGIPIFVSEKRDISTLEAVKLVDIAYRAFLGGYKREDVLAYAKCGLSGIVGEDCDAFELYTERWKLSGNSFLREDIWNMNPDGYTDRWREGAEDVLRTIDRTRHAVIDPIQQLNEQAMSAKTVREHATALMDFLLTVDLEKALAARAEELYRLNEPVAAEENERIFSVLCDTLAHMVDVMGNETADARAFHMLWSIACSAVDIGRIPAYTDCVTIGSADMLRVADKRHVILFGVHEGEFPAATKETAWFTERERGLLFSLGFTPEPADREDAARELFYFSRAFTSASETVTLICSKRSTSFRPLRRADVLRRLTDMTGGLINVIDSTHLSLRDTVYTPPSAMSHLANERLCEEEQAALRDALMTTPFAEQTLRGQHSILNEDLSLSSDMASDMYGHDIALTQSRMEQFLACPLQHFCNYVLHLDDNRRASFDAMNIGTFVHSILEHFFKDVRDKAEDLNTVTSEDIRTRVEQLSSDYIRHIRADSLQSTVRLHHFLHRLTRTAIVITEGLVEEFRDCRFAPRFFELPIRRNQPDAPDPVVCTTTDGHGVYVYGTIDRVDTMEHNGNVYVRVVDYKTGRKRFSPSDLAEGHNLQMFLYLRAVTESERFRVALGVGAQGAVIPAGVIYAGTHLSDKPLPTPAEDAEATFKAGQTRSGMLLSDPISIGGMNERYLPFRLNKNKEPDARAQDKLYTADGWNALCDTVTDSVVRIAERMKCGKIPAAPMKSTHSTSTCEHCSYKPICRNAQL